MVDRDPARPTVSRWSLRRWTTVLALLSLVVTVVAVSIGALALSSLTTARMQLLDQLDPALLAAQQLSVAVMNQETGVQGYAVTADPGFLTPYEEGRAQQAAAAETLHRLSAVAPRPELVGGLDAVRDTVQRWRTGYAEPTLAAVRARAPLPDPAVGKTLFDAARAALDAQRTGLTEARNRARLDLDEAAARLGWTGGGIAAGLAGLVAALVFWIRNTVTKPISRLTDTVRAVAAGSFDRRIETAPGPKEINQLATDVDSMRQRILFELSRMRELNDRLTEQAEDLARSNRDLEQFAYAASHDLQEPLRKVSGFCELLQSRYADQLDERANTYIGFAVDGARRMSALINDLLAYSRVGRSGVEPSEQDTEALLAEAERVLARPLEEAGARVTHDPLPTVVGEASLITTLLQNLIGNALKFRGDEPPRIHVTARRVDDHWEFGVSDNGIGIESAYADKIFVIFQRLHPKEAYPGTGIGLAMCRKIVEYHGGTIWLDPCSTAGATFRFTLPAVRDPRPAADDGSREERTAP